VPTNICEVIIAAILYADLEPVYVDVDPVIGNVSLSHIESCPLDEVGVVIAVHHFGSPLPIADICAWARQHNIFVIEDVCNSLGAVADGRPAGTWGDAAIYSFGPGKILDVGEGGVLAARDSKFLNACYRLENNLDIWGSRQQSRDKAFQACLRTLRLYRELKDPTIYHALYKRYKPALVARSGGDTAIKIATGLKGLCDNLEIRRIRSNYYREYLNHSSILHRPLQSGEVCWRYTCHIEENLRDGAINHLRNCELPVSTWYPAVDKFFRERPDGCRFPGADLFEKRVVNLWVEPPTADEIITRTTSELVQYLEHAHHDKHRRNPTH